MVAAATQHIRCCNLTRFSEHGPSQPNNGSVKLLEDVHKAVELDNVIIAQVMSNLIITVATLQSGAAIAKDSQMPLVAALPG